MAQLVCGAKNCCYNKEQLCCKGDIMVAGKHAECSENTCCESFYRQKTDTFSSSISHPSATISIDCEALKCRYNVNYRCQAKQVDIRGSQAENATQTSCATFCEQM